MTQIVDQLAGRHSASPATAPRHSLAEDVIGLTTGAFVASVGLFVLHTGGVITGGTAGLALLLAHVLPLGFSGIYLLLSLPFVALAVSRKGWPFTVRSAASVAAVSGFALLHPLAAHMQHLNQVYAALVGNLVLGLGILILFRHGASLGGFNVVALICQERRGWRAGYVQLALDAAVVASFFAVGDASHVALSAAGATVLNLVLAMNHRPGRYVAGDRGY